MEWQEALGQLLESSDLRVRLGTAAHEDIKAEHTTLVQAPLLYETIAGLHGERYGRALTVHCLGDSDSLSGRHASNLVRLVKHFRKAKHTVRVFANGSGAASALPQSDELRIEALPERSGTVLADVSIALDAQSAATLAERPDALFRVFLVDDSGAGRQFSDRVLSGLLELPLRPICIGEETASRLSKLRAIHVDCLSVPFDPAHFERMLLEECFVRATSLNIALSQPTM